MKLSNITASSIVALAAAALIANGALASQNHNSSRSNKTFKLDAGNPDAEKQCIDEGGSVKDGMCVMPEGPPQPVEAATVKSSKSNSSERTGGPPQPADGATINNSKSVNLKTGATPQPADGPTIKTTKSNTFKSGGTPGTTEAKNICIIYKPGHEGDDRYCSQSVPAPK